MKIPIQARQNRREAVDENTEDRGRHRRIGVDAAVRRVEGPAGIQASSQHGINEECATDDIEVPAQQVDLREGEVFRADHQRDQEISEDRRNGRNQEKENHGHAVHGEKLVIGFRSDEGAAGSQQVDADHGGEDAADEKEESDRSKIQKSDAFVVGGKQPRFNAIGGIEIMLPRHLKTGRWRRLAHNYFFSVAGPVSAPFGATPEPLAGTGWDCSDLM